MTTFDIFVSHNHNDNDNRKCEQIVQALQDAGAHVWFDANDFDNGTVMDVVQREIERCSIFIPILSKAAFASKWVLREARWAYELADRDPTRIILPVTVEPIDRGDFGGANGWLFLADFRRIEQPSLKPLPMDEAIRQLLIALALTPKGETPTHVTPHALITIQELMFYGKALRAQGKFAEAEPFFRHATELEPTSFIAWFNLGYTLGELRRWQDALAVYQHALAIAPDSNIVLDNTGPNMLPSRSGTSASYTLYNMGRTYSNLRQYDSALNCYERAMEMSPFFVHALTGKARALFELGRYDDALKWCGKALELRPDFESALTTRGNVLRKLKRPDEALADFEKVYSLHPSANTQNNRGNALTDLGRYDEALEAFDGALRIQPGYVFSWYNRGNVLMKQRRFTEALAAYNSFLEAEPRSVNGWLNTGSALWELGRYEDALTAYNRALMLDPQNSAARQGKAMTLRQLGRNE